MMPPITPPAMPPGTPPTIPFRSSAMPSVRWKRKPNPPPPPPPLPKPRPATAITSAAPPACPKPFCRGTTAVLRPTVRYFIATAYSEWRARAPPASPEMFLHQSHGAFQRFGLKKRVRRPLKLNSSEVVPETKRQFGRHAPAEESRAALRGCLRGAAVDV